MTDSPNPPAARIEAATEAFWTSAGKPWGALNAEGRTRAYVHMRAALEAADEAERPGVEAKHEAEMLAVIDERDRIEEWADKLAYAIAPQSVIGEHSSANNPWANALEICESRPGVGRLVAALRAGVTMLDHMYGTAGDFSHYARTWVADARNLLAEFESQPAGESS